MTKIEIEHRLGLTDLGLLERLPVRYENMRPTPEIPQESLSDGDRIKIAVTIEQVRPLLQRRMIRFTGRGLYSHHLYSFCVFNQMYYLNRIASGKKLFIAAVYRRKALFVSGVYELDNRYVTSGLKPIYKLPKEIGQSSYAHAIEQILNSDIQSTIKDIIPSDIVRKYHLLSRAEAFYRVHLPRNVKDRDLGLRTFQYEECLAYCLTSAANRKYLSLLKKASQKQIDIHSLNKLVASTGYTLTHDQIAAVKDIVADMNSKRVMFRLLQGDVSTGKTLVAIFALYANYLRGGQGSLIVPTQALAQQHYANLQRILSPLGLQVALLTSKMKAADRRKIIDGLAAGTVNILITTIAGAGDDVVYKNLSLTVIDEQQSFGVEQRAELIGKGSATDTLMMSATPIPRTVLKLQSRDMELSELREFPKGIVRRVQTKVVKSDDPLISKAIEKAVAKDRRVFVIVPRVEETQVASEEFGENVSAKEVYERYAKLYGADRVGLLHGRIKSADQERILTDFKSGAKPILVATSVVEVGMDIQEAGLMIIYSANLFGLSGLHQLRGRIGRDGRYALCMLVYDGSDEETRKKLDFIAAHSDGFDIALYDAKTRGTGSLSGMNQSGGSDLAVADFVGNASMLECASQDAETILAEMNSHPDYAEYARRTIRGNRIKAALLG